MASAVVEIGLEGTFSADSLQEQLESARATGEARVALLLARADAQPEPFSEELLRALPRFELPLVFAFESAVTGALAELALAADVRICAETASLQGPLRDESRARSLSDEPTASSLVLGRDVFGAPALLASGLVSHVAPAGGAAAEARRVAQVIASRGPIATRLGKEAIWRGLGQPLEQALRFETDLTLLLQTTKDRAEGVRAFLQKRPPIFTGE